MLPHSAARSARHAALTLDNFLSQGQHVSHVVDVCGHSTDRAGVVAPLDALAARPSRKRKGAALGSLNSASNVLGGFVPQIRPRSHMSAKS